MNELQDVLRSLAALSRYMQDEVLSRVKDDPKKESELWRAVAADCEQSIAETTPVEDGGAA